MRPLAHRKFLFKTSPHATAALEGVVWTRRRTATHVLQSIGQWCVDNGTDGRVSRDALRQLHDFASWRVMQTYVTLLVGLGILLDCGQGEYLIDRFDEDHPPAWRMAEIYAHRRQQATERVRRHRARVRRSSVKPMIPATSVPCNAESTPVDPDLPTNKRREAPSVASKKSVVEESGEAYDFEAAVRRIAAVRAEAVKENPFVAPRPAVRAYRPARMPQQQRPVNEGDVASAVRSLGLPPAKVPELYGALWRMKATDVEVGYAAYMTARRKDVRHRERYLLAIIDTQRRHRLAG